jgi:lipoprotein-anchoring transpeptidase ErfK/SrfK
MRMTSYFVGPKYKPTWLRPARLAVASLAAVITVGDHAVAAKSRNERAVAFESRVVVEPAEPIMAIISLRSQRITVYDAKGWILQAPVSSGQKGRETPAGIFSVIEKQAEHWAAALERPAALAVQGRTRQSHDETGCDRR